MLDLHLRHLRKILIHKWYVFIECCKLGVPWQGIVHDLSKFTPAEWKAYVLHFYAYQEHEPQWVVDAFSAAWNHHQKQNPHHFEYWILLWRGKPDETLPMPDRYRREMLADWRGASRAYSGNDDVASWYLRRRDEIRLHPETRAWIEGQLGI